MIEKDQIFLEFIIKELVDHPESVKIERKIDAMGVLLSLDVHPEDMGKVIGRKGNTAIAIRTLLRIIGMKNNAKVNLKINEPEGGLHSAPPMSMQPVTKSIDEAMAEL
ncbi:MAG TPA: KH domain-containing protein [Candidatus Paceibacterota bacterium]